MVQLTGYAERYPSELSGGQQQRVAVARLIALRPTILLMDEPLSNLDAKLRASMRTELIKLHRKLNTTTIHVTHDQVEAMTMGERICILHQGKLIQLGTPLDIYNNPVNTFVAGFLGSPPMNLFDTKILPNNDCLNFKISNNLISLPNKEFRTLIKYSGCEIKFGIRPEDLYIEKISKNMIDFEVSVLAVESLGSEAIIVANFENGQEIYAKVDRNFQAAYKDKLRIYFDFNKIKFFNKNSTEAIKINSI